jgi:hypothetical protein
METGLTKNTILSELSKSPHGKLQEYVPIGLKAAEQEPEFFAHLVAWDRLKGQIRDAKVALPVVSLKAKNYPDEFIDNSLAHIALLGPRELERAYRFALELRPAGRMRTLRRLIEAYLKKIEAVPQKWDSMVTQDRKTFANLYALGHCKRSDRVGDILFYQHNGKMAHPEGSKREIVAQLINMSALEAAGAILEHNIPFMAAQGALGKKINDPDLVLALIKKMTPSQLVTNVKMLERLGVKTNPALRGVFEEALEKASKSTKNVLKTTRAAEQISDEGLKGKLQNLQEKQLKRAAGIEGNWLILADKSPSMSNAIETARLVAGTLGKMVKNKITLVFFDSVASRVFDVTGKSYDEIKSDTKWITADGAGTSIGCGVQYAIDRSVEADGIAIVSDAQENTAPRFADTYKRYCTTLGKEVPVYLYRLAPSMHGIGDIDLAQSMKRAEIDLQEFDLRGGVDFYSLPNIVSTMRVQRYGLLEEIMEFPLLTLNDVFKTKVETVEEAVVA